jgi:hypothetical protein
MLKGDNHRSKTKFRGCIALSICMIIRAIHVELANDLSSETFLTVLKTFVPGSKRPACIYSDNDTNFMGSNNELKHFFTGE